MKKWIVVFFIVLLVIYAGGALCVSFGWYDWDFYFKIVAIVGGLASIIGLGAAAFVRIDLLSYGAEAIEKLANAAKEIESKESQIRDASDKIEALQYKKEELEVLVRKASLVLYYKEELNTLYEALMNMIRRDNKLDSVIKKIAEMENQLTKLEGEMDTNPEIREVLTTIQKAKSKKGFEVAFKSILSYYFRW